MSQTGITYHRPTTLSEACDLGREFGAAGRYLAGGTEVLVDLRQGRFDTEHVISLQSVAGELNRISLTGGGLRIGALATIQDVAESDPVRQSFPVLGHAALRIGSVQIRSRATIGGNFCGAVPCADTPPVCIAGGARLRLVGPAGERTVAARDFFRGPRESILQPGEVMAEIIVDAQPEHSGLSYQRFHLRHGSALAVASVAARIILDAGTISHADVVLGAVAPVPLPAVQSSALLEGNEPTAELFAAAADAAAAEAKPISDVRGTESFRRELVRVLTVRALGEALQRAGGELQ